MEGGGTLLSLIRAMKFRDVEVDSCFFLEILIHQRSKLPVQQMPKDMCFIKTKHKVYGKCVGDALASWPKSVLRMLSFFFGCIWSQKCPEIICNFMQNSSGLTRSQAYQRLFPCMRQLWNWALHGLNNGRPVTLAEQNQVSTLSFISANGIINYK